MKAKPMLALFVLLLAALLNGCGKNAAAPQSPAPPKLSAAPLPTATAPPPSVTAPLPSPKASEPVPADDAFVRILDYIPDIYVELKYAGEDNFTGKVIYSFQDAYLRYGTLKKLIDVQNELSEKGLSLKIWDAFRPVSAQSTLWQVCPNPTYVSNPQTGYSSHCKGSALDLTLVYTDGTELEMPTGFDDFSPLADRDYSDVGESAAENARLLESTMLAHGFEAYFGEWWHFSDSVPYPPEKDFTPPSTEN
ncbi:MAG: M15 family metallopeptidase [Oscillospiraceae bacterium]